MFWTPLAALLLPIVSADPDPPLGAVQQDSGELYVRAATIYLDGERVIEDGVLYVQGGRIRSAGRGVDVPAGATLIEHDGVLTAGMVSCGATVGAEGELEDSTRSLLPEARAAHAFNPSHRDFERMLAFGITSVVLAPTDRNVAGGVSAVARTDGSSLLSEEAHLTLSFSGAALDVTRAPTSYSGALVALRAAMDEPSGIWAEAASGRLPVLMHARSRHEVVRAAEFARAHELRGIVAGAPWVGEVADVVGDAGLGVVVGPFGPGTTRRTLDSTLAIAEAGIPFAFATTRADADGDPLRFSAALCVRHGLDPLTAWRALTADAARLAGVDDQVGTLESGKQADFVLWDGDPLDLTSSVHAVYVAGRRVHGGKR